MQINSIRHLIKKQKVIRGSVLSIFALLIISYNFASGASETEKRDTDGCNVKQGLIILVEFLDVQHSVDRRFVQRRFFRELNSYVQEMSYNKVCIGGNITEKWHKMPHPISHYKISPRNLEVDKSRVTNLINDTLDAVDKDVDFSKYSFVVIFMGAQRTEYGMIGLSGYPGMLG